MNPSEAKPPEINISQPDFNFNETKPTTQANHTRQLEKNQQTATIIQKEFLKPEISNSVTIPPEPDLSKPTKIPLISDLGLPYQGDWSELTEEHKMIRQFIPLPDVSSFFNKLKAFGEEKLEGQ